MKNYTKFHKVVTKLHKVNLLNLCVYKNKPNFEKLHKVSQSSHKVSQSYLQTLRLILCELCKVKRLKLTQSKSIVAMCL